MFGDFLRDRLVVGIKLPDGKRVGCNGVVCKV